MQTIKRYKYFAISERDKSWGIYVLNNGSHVLPQNVQYPARDHPAHHYFRWSSGRVLQEFQFFYLVEGEGEFESEKTGLISIRAGHVIMLFPNVWHRYRPLKNSSWNTHWVGFDGPFARHLQEAGFINPAKPVIEIGYNEQIIQLLQKMQDTGQNELAGYQQVMSGYLIQVLGHIYAIQHRQPFQNQGYETLMQQAKVILAQSVEHAIRMETVARQLGIGYSLFRRTFKEYSGLSPGQYLIHLKIERAKELLAESHRYIKEIAYQLGFESVSYFTRLFKEKTGFAPSQFRDHFTNEISEPPESESSNQAD